MPIQTEFITEFRQLEAMSADWDRLWHGDSEQTIFGRFAWAKASWQAYGPSLRLCTLVMRDRNAICGILPLAVAGGTLQFLGASRSDYNDILAESERSSEIVDAAFRSLKHAPVDWSRCELTNLSERSILFQRLSRQHRVPGVSTHLSFSADCPSVELGADREATLKAILGKKSLRRYENKLGRLGTVSFRHIEQRNEAQSHLPELYRQHIARWTMTGQRSLFQDQLACQFYERLLDEFDLKRELRFGVVEVADRPVAYHLGFETNKTFYWYKPTFDIDLWDYSPGEVLLKKLFEYVSDREVKRFDFTVGNEGFKNRFANCVAKNYTLQVFRSGSVSRLIPIVKESLKRHPTIFRVIRSGPSIISGSAQQFRRVVSRHGVLNTMRKLALVVWREAFFSHDEVLVFAKRGNELESKIENIEIRQGTLSVLTALAELHSEYLTVGKLAQARQRLRQGDSLFTAWNGGELAHIAWMGIREEITAAFEVGDKCRINLEEPSPVVYDCWTPPRMRGQGIYPTVLTEIIRHNCKTPTEHWIYCLRDNIASKRGIEKAGFTLRYRMRRIRLARYIERNRVLTEAASLDGFPI